LAPTSKVSSKQYVDIVPIGPTGARTSSLGWVATSIGVYDGPNGVPCGRVSYDKGEAIEVKLGSDIPGDVFAFDRLELDVEVKGDVKLTMEVKFGSRVNQYHLWTGAAVGSAGADDEPRVLRPGDNVYRCKAASDSGPDSGASDNCRWIIEDVGSSFKITLEAGEFSLEGGGDHVDPLGKRSFIYLAEPDGTLDCGQSADSVDTEDGVACTVDRLDNENCTAVPYIFREVSTASGQTCDFAADMGGQQLIANIFASYGIEPQEIGDPKTLGTWLPRPLSRVLFNNSPIDYPIPPCLGLTLTNMDLDSDPRVGPDPILEIDQTYDRVDTVATDDTIEFACAFMRREVYGSIFTTDSNGSPVVIPTTRVEEGIQFWGDPSFSRPGISSN